MGKFNALRPDDKILGCLATLQTTTARVSCALLISEGKKKASRSNDGQRKLRSVGAIERYKLRYLSRLPFNVPTLF